MSQELATTPQNPMALLMGADLSTIDPDKLEKLLALQERWEDRQAEKQLAAALTAFQADCPSIMKVRQNIHLKTAYAKLDDIMATIQPVLSKHGLSVSFDTPSDKESLTAICYVMHSSGAKFSRQVTVPVDTGMRGANITQQLGSASSYAQRYALISALNLPVTDRKDDDAVTTTEFVTVEQAKEIQDLYNALPLERKEGFMEWIQKLGAETIQFIKKSDYKKVLGNLKRA